MKLEWLTKMQKLIPSTKFPSLTNYILIAILILGLVLRVYKLTSLPMYGDELTLVYDSYSILKTGMDQTGEKLPLTFKMGAGRPAGYVYGSIPFVAVFGPTEWGVRGLSLVSGLGIIVLMYFLGKKLFSNNVGLWASFLTSISMWDIYLSRAGFEAHFALFLAILGVLMFLNNRYILMALLFGISVFTYPTFKVTVPLMILALMFYTSSGSYREFFKIFKNKSFLIGIAILVVFALVTMNESLRGLSEERFLRLNVLSDSQLKEEVLQNVNEKRTLSTLPEAIKPYVYNRPLLYSRILFEKYVENLSPQFLYLRGDRNPRANPGEWGMLYMAELGLLFIGLYHLAKNERKNLILIVSWILITPLATMLLGQTHALRNNFMLPPFVLISAYALSVISNKAKLVFVGLIVFQLLYVLGTIYYFAPNKFGSFWSEKAKIESLKAIEKSKSEKVVLSTDIDNIEYAYPVYAKIEPGLVISQYGKFPKVYGNVIISDENN